MRRIPQSPVVLAGSVAAALLTFAAPDPSSADELIRSGGEIQVNTTTTGNQGYPEIAVGPDGRFVIAWESFGQDGSSWGVVGQRFAANGTPEGDEFQVNTTTADTQWDPSVAVGSDGSFVVAWQSYQAGSDYDVRAQRYDSAGMAQGGELVVNSYTQGYQGNTSVAVDDSGNFLVVWESQGQDLSDKGVYGQLFDSAGTPVGDELQINTTTAANQNDPRITARDGGFAVAWESDLQDGSEETTILQFLDSMGANDGSEMVVNTQTLGDQEDPAVAVLDDGTFAVAWESDAQDGDGEGIFVRVFDSNGSPISGEMQLNSYTSGDQENPRLAPDGAGGFLAVWSSFGQLDGTSDEIYGRRFDTSGTPVGDEIRVNSQATDFQDIPVIASGPGGQALVAWRSFGGHDGDGAGVFAQSLVVALFADGFESGNLDGWSTSSP